MHVAHSTMIQHGWMDCLIELTSDLPHIDGTLEPIPNKEKEVMAELNKEFDQEIQQLRGTGMFIW